MNLDFAFIDGAGRLVMTGWDEAADLHMTVETAAAPLSVTVLERFARADLGPLPLGWLAIAQTGDGLPPLTLTDRDGGHRDLDAYALTQGDATLIAQALNETVTALMRAIARGAVGPLSDAATASLIARARNVAHPLPAELEEVAVGLDQFLVGPNGLGLIRGWALSTTAAAHPLVGLVTDGARLIPASLAFGTDRRDDLVVYAGRYRITPHAGLAGSFRLPPAGERSCFLILMPADPALGHGLMLQAAGAVTDGAAAGAMAAALASLPSAADRAALLQPLALQRVAVPRGPLTLPDARACAAGTLLLMVPDVEPTELRDALRMLLPGLPPPVTVRLVAEVMPPGAEAAVAAALAEAGTDATMGEPLPLAAIQSLAVECGEAVFGPASALLQLGLPAPSTARLHDPLSPPDTQPAALLRHPFTLRLPGAVLAAALKGAPRGLLTAEGTVAAALQPLAEAGALTIEAGGTAPFWPGTGGPGPRLDAILLGAVDV